MGTITNLIKTKIMKFSKITRKKFIEDMTSSMVIFIQGGYTSLKLENQKWEQSIIEHCENNIEIDLADKCVCVMKSNRMERILPDGEVSCLYLDDKCKRTFYAYNNIRIVEKSSNNCDRKNYCIYLCV